MFLRKEIDKRRQDFTGKSCKRLVFFHNSISSYPRPQELCRTRVEGALDHYAKFQIKTKCLQAPPSHWKWALRWRNFKFPQNCFLNNFFLKITTIKKLKTCLPSLKVSVDKFIQSKVVYKISCSRCEACYVGQTARHLITRTKEHFRNGPVATHIR